MTVERTVREELPPASGDFSSTDLFQQTYRRLVRLAVSRGVDLDSAHDLAQDAFTALFERRPVVLNPEHWLVRIVLRRSCDFWRRRAIEQRALARLPPQDCLPTTADPIRRRRLTAALLSLPPKSRMLIRSRYFEGLDEAAAAHKAGYLHASYKKAMSRALAKLRNALRAGPASRSGRGLTGAPAD